MQNPHMCPWRGLVLRWLPCAMLALVPWLTGCEGIPQRFDSYPIPMSTRVVVDMGLRNDEAKWACIDSAHDQYLIHWASLAAEDATRLSDSIHVLSNPFETQNPGEWMTDLNTVQGFARRHASIMNRMEALDEALLNDWGACLGPAWSEPMEDLRVNRSIDRWRNVAEANGPAMIDLRLLLPSLPLDDARRTQLADALRTYARSLAPLARAVADAKLHVPAQAIELRQRLLAAGEKVDEKLVTEQIRLRVRRVNDSVIRLALSTIEGLRSTLPAETLDRLRDAVVDVADRRRPRHGQELLAEVAMELTTIPAATRAIIRTANEVYETADRVLRQQIADIVMRDPEAPALKDLRKERNQLLKFLNARVLEALPEDMRVSMQRMQKESPDELRRTLDTIFDPDIAARLQRGLPDPDPIPPTQRLPIRKSSDALGQLMPSDFAAWAAIRIPSLAKGNPDRQDPMRLLVSDAQERWNTVYTDSLSRLQPMQKLVEEGLRDESSLSELQRRIRMAVAELDAARSRLQLIEDPVLADAAALMGLDSNDPQVERLRLERAAEFAGLGWRDMPVQTLFRLDREATIDLATTIEELELSDASRAIADMALVDSSVPIIESAELLRQACVQALRSLVLNLKRAQLRGVSEKEMGFEMGKVVKSGIAAIAMSAEMRMRVQRDLLDEICEAISPAEARSLRLAYWRRAYPELFLERKPPAHALEQLAHGLAMNEQARLRAEKILEERQQQNDRALPAMIQARKRWVTDAMRTNRDTLSQLEREAPVLGTVLRIREEIDARALRKLAILHGDDPVAWNIVIDWGRERPVAYDGLP